MLTDNQETEVTVETEPTLEITEQTDTTPEIVTEVETPTDGDVPVPTEEIVEEATEEVEAVPTEEIVAEPIVFDYKADDFTEKVTATLKKYDLTDTPELAAAFEALQAKVNDNPLTPYADYGEPENITSALDRNNLLLSMRETDEPGVFRPNTDKFVETLPEDKADWFYFDLAKSPSLKYNGLSKFAEGMVDALALEGDTVPVVLKRYDDFMAAMKNGAIVSDVPLFIPPDLVPAFKSLSIESRNEIAYLDPEDNKDDVVRKLGELRGIQKGIDGDLREERRLAQDKAVKAQTFTNEVQKTTSTFINEFRNTFTDNLIKNVVFSDDPNRQNYQARQLVITLDNAFADDSSGEYARLALKEAGIDFDHSKAQSLLKNIEKAAVELTSAKSQVDDKGNSLDPVALNKAKTQFANIGRDWQDFAKKILDQQTKVVAEGKAKDVATEVAKIKVAPKARAGVKAATPSPVKTVNDNKPPANIRYGTPQWDEWYADRTIAEHARKVAAYQ